MPGQIHFLPSHCPGCFVIAKFYQIHLSHTNQFDILKVMTNPYLSAAQEMTGQDLQQVPNTQELSRVIRKEAKRIKAERPSGPRMPQNPFIDAITNKQLPQGPRIVPSRATLDGFSGLGGLSGFSKIRKMIFLTALGAGFAASKFYIDKFEVAVLAEHPEFKDLRTLIPTVDKIMLPVVGLMAFPTALALFTDQEWPMLGWICRLGAIAYSLKEVGPGAYRTFKDSTVASDEYREKKLTALRSRKRRKRAKKKA
jgi:hypothetical protein